VSRHHHRTVTSLARRLRPTSADFAGAAALQDPSLLLQLQAAQIRERSIRPAPPRHRRGGSSSIRRALAGESGGALLLVAAIALALLWSNSPWQGSYTAVWHAPVALTIGPWALVADLRTWIMKG
jgi:hypothetical protein